MCYPSWIRTNPKCTKNICATATPSGNVGRIRRVLSTKTLSLTSKKSERNKTFLWTCLGSNQGPIHYEWSALTNWATGPNLTTDWLLSNFGGSYHSISVVQGVTHPSVTLLFLSPDVATPTLGTITLFVGAEGFEPPMSKTDDLQSSEQPLLNTPKIGKEKMVAWTSPFMIGVTLVYFSQLRWYRPKYTLMS